MHRTGTSLVANLLHNAMGVQMGHRFLGKGPWNRSGVWEDRDFVGMNRKLLKGAGAHKPYWRNLPEQEHIDWFKHIIPCTVQVKTLVQRKLKLRWGWKDPRTCLTIGLYARWLLNPVYVVTQRDRADVIRSLEKRGHTRGEDYWRRLIERYERARDVFLTKTDRPVVTVRFERLTNKQHWRAEVAKVEEAARVDVDEQRAREIIEWR